MVWQLERVAPPGRTAYASLDVIVAREFGGGARWMVPETMGIPDLVELVTTLEDACAPEAMRTRDAALVRHCSRLATHVGLPGSPVPRLPELERYRWRGSTERAGRAAHDRSRPSPGAAG